MQVVLLEERFDLFEKQNAVDAEAWPGFIVYSVDSDWWVRSIEIFKSFQLMIIEDDEILTIIGTVPLCFEGEPCDLPDNGWDWGMEKALKDYENRIAPNALMGTQITVNKNHRGKGLSSIAVNEMIKFVRRKGFGRLFIPVRPSEKHNYPLTPMEKYINWRNKKGQPFDAWLRLHVGVGGEIVKVCHKSMNITASVEEWETWTNMAFPETGEYIVDGALNPVSINIEQNTGVYIEPNVWVLHKV